MLFPVKGQRVYDIHIPFDPSLGKAFTGCKIFWNQTPIAMKKENMYKLWRDGIGIMTRFGRNEVENSMPTYEQDMCYTFPWQSKRCALIFWTSKELFMIFSKLVFWLLNIFYNFLNFSISHSFVQIYGNIYRDNNIKWYQTTVKIKCFLKMHSFKTQSFGRHKTKIWDNMNCLQRCCKRCLFHINMWIMQMKFKLTDFFYIRGFCSLNGILDQQRSNVTHLILQLCKNGVLRIPFATVMDLLFDWYPT